MDMDTTLVIDDDDDVVMLDKTENIQNNAKSTRDVINLEEETPCNEHSNEALADHETPSNNHEANLNRDEEDFAKLLKSNTLMNKIIKKCLNMDNNKGVQFIINKTLLPVYKNVDRDFKKSDYLLEMLNRVMDNLKRDPGHKFSHIKSLCMELKKNQQKKKVPFVTLATDIRRSRRKCSAPEIQKITNQRNEYSNKNTSPVIDLDNSDEEKVIHLVDGDESDDDVMIVHETDKEGAVGQSNKENCYKPDKVTVVAGSDNDLLIPKKSVVINHQKSDSQKAKHVIKEIEFCKSILDKLEEEEIVNDSTFSPYVKCDKIKTKIVELYKRLRNLTGGDGNISKQRFIRLQAVEGHPAGPIRRLEKFLNSTMDKTGFIPLPDYHDVVRCVTQSNIVDRLGWDKQQINNEAIALFTHCGHALRQNRQRREYKDLLSLMREKDIDDNDPANEDPLLLARLEENKLIAKANENEIIDRYANMEAMSKLPYVVRPGQTEIFRMKPASSDSDSENESDKQINKMRSMVTSKIDHNINKTPNVNQNVSHQTEHVNEETVTSFTSASTQNTVCGKAKNSLAQNIVVTAGHQPLRNQITTSVPLQNNTKSVPTLQILPITSNTYSDYQSFIRQNDKSNINHDSQTMEGNQDNTNVILNSNYNNNLNEIDINERQENKNINSAKIIENNLNKPKIACNTPIESRVNYVDTKVSGTNEVVIVNPNMKEINNKCNESCGGNDKSTENNEVETAVNGLLIYTQNHINETPMSYDVAYESNVVPIVKIPKISNSHFKETIVTGKWDKQYSDLEKLSETPDDNTQEETIIKEEPIDIEEHDILTRITENNIHTSQECNKNEKVTKIKNDREKIQHIDSKLPQNNNFDIEENIIKQKTPEAQKKDSEPFDDVNMLLSSNNITGDTVIKQNQIEIQHNMSNTQQNSNIIDNIAETRVEPLDLENITSKIVDTENNLTETHSNNDSLENDASASQNVKLEKPVTIKQEPIDINKLLNSLGDNYISTIFDIEDPFLVIDISSDSSSEDDL